MNRRWLGVGAIAVAAAACGHSEGEAARQAHSVPHTFPNDQAAFDYFIGKGLAGFQAAGIVGNLDQESGVDPNSVQLDGGPGRGIAQWEVGGRWDTNSNDNCLAYASQQGSDPHSLNLQLDFVWYELSNFSNYGLADLQGSTDVSSATIAFQNDFEGCGQCDQSTRIAYAQAVLDAYGSDAPGGGGPPPPPPPGGSSGGGGDPCSGINDCAYCGNDSQGPGGDPDTLYQCSGGVLVGSTPCANGCQITAGNSCDVCNQGSGDPCAGFNDGDYCGNDPNGGPAGDPNTLYTCTGGVTTSVQPCPNGCQVVSGAANDYCN